jgi:hypothetical protein
VLQADTRRTERDFASFIGARFLFNRGGIALSGSGGISHQSGRPGANDQLVGEAQAAWYRELSDHGQLAGEIAAGRDADGGYARASAYARTTALNARADILQQFGDRPTTQYAVTLDGGFVLSRAGIGVTGRDINDSAVMVTVRGSDPGQRFDVLVDEVARGTVADGGHLVLFVEPYRQYAVRLRPLGEQIASFDTGSRFLTVYPGNVSRLDWNITSLFILFGRALAEDGRPVANADIVGPHGIGRTDGDGYFQVEADGGDVLRLSQAAGQDCMLRIAPAKPAGGLVSAGDMRCQ